MFLRRGASLQPCRQLLQSSPDHLEGHSLPVTAVAVTELQRPECWLDESGPSNEFDVSKLKRNNETTPWAAVKMFFSIFSSKSQFRATSGSYLSCAHWPSPKHPERSLNSGASNKKGSTSGRSSWDLDTVCGQCVFAFFSPGVR